MTVVTALTTKAGSDHAFADAPREALGRALSAWNAGDLDGYLALYDQGISLHGYSPEPMTKVEVEGFYRMIFATLKEDGRPAPGLRFEGVVADADRVALRFIMSGHHVGPFMGHAPTGRPYVLNGITILRFNDERVVERW